MKCQGRWRRVEDTQLPNFSTAPIEVDIDCYVGDLPFDLVVEAKRRRDIDGIPRYIAADGRIIKCDWELVSADSNDNLEGEALEEHIRKLMKEQGVNVWEEEGGSSDSGA
jgi:hypothetical protein